MNYDTNYFNKAPQGGATKGYGILQGGTIRVTVGVHSTFYNQGLKVYYKGYFSLAHLVRELTLRG